MQRILVEVTGPTEDSKTQRDEENHVYQIVNGLGKTIIHITYEDTKIEELDFKGKRPAQTKIKKGKGEETAHIESVAQIKDNIKNKYIKQKIDGLGFHYTMNFYETDENAEKSRLKECSKQIALEYLSAVKNPNNLYSSSREHNQTLAHILQKINGTTPPREYPLNIEINQKYHDQTEKNFPEYFESGKLVIENEETLNLIKKSCNTDDPRQNAEHVADQNAKMDRWDRWNKIETVDHSFFFKEPREKNEKESTFYSASRETKEHKEKDKKKLTSSRASHQAKQDNQDSSEKKEKKSTRRSSLK